MSYRMDEVWDVSTTYLNVLYSYNVTERIFDNYQDNSHLNDPIAMFKLHFYRDNWRSYLWEIYEFFNKKAKSKKNKHGDPNIKELLSSLKTNKTTWNRISKVRHAVFHIPVHGKSRLDASMDLFQYGEEGDEERLVSDMYKFGEYIAKVNGRYSYTPEEDEKEFRWQMENVTKPGLPSPKL